MPFSEHRNEFTQEAIRQRMAQHMMRLWDVKTLNNIDPFARLMMDVLAGELNKISHEFLNSEVGLLNRLAQLLTPDLLTVPRPAHAVVWVQPADPTAYMGPTESLFLTQRIASKPYGELDTRHDIFLSPVDTVKLFDGRVACMAAGKGLFYFDKDGNKHLKHQTEYPGKLPAHTLWLGLALHPEITSLDRLGFYLELPRVTGADALFDLFQLGRWSIGGQPLTARPGLSYAPEPGRYQPPLDEEGQLLVNSSLDHLLEQDVKNDYHHQFIHLHQPAKVPLAALRVPYPTPFASAFGGAALHELEAQPLLWLEVVLPAAFDDRVLDQLTMRMNVVPVMNRRLHRLTYRTRIMHNILPLPVQPRETFLAVRSLTDSGNHVFTPYPLRQSDQLGSGYYTVRRSGIERFDPRDAREQLHYLLEVLRDESVAFSAYGHDNVQLEAHQLNRQVEHLERLLTQQDGAVRELPHYLLVRPHAEFDTLQVSYWTTDCESGNNIHAGTELQPYDISYLKPDHSPVLLTTTRGGQNRLQAASQLDAYRYALLSHERIVTNEDIRAFVKAELGALLSGVDISKGVMIGNLAKQGFIRTIDVSLIPAAYSVLGEAEWQALCRDIYTKLVSRSGQTGQYRVLVKSG